MSDHQKPPVPSRGVDPDATAVVARLMIAAREAQPGWSRTPLARRLELIRQLRRLIAEHAAQLAEASALPRQRPVLESLTAEVLPLAEACRFLEREAARVLAPRRLGKRGRPLWLAGVHSEIHCEPLGVILIIGPGNYPLLLPGVQLVQALAAGNALLLKPGIGGTAAAQALIELVVRVGFDPRLVALLPESSAAARCAIKARPDKVLFTGSSVTGEQILGQLAPEVVPATMELSGCDAVVVRADADLVVRAITFGLRLNGGATCMAPKRVLVHRSIATELEGRLAQSFCLRGGDPYRPLVHSSSAAAESLRPAVDDALARGAHLISGEINEDGSLTLPLVLGGVSPCSRLLREAIFAPVVALVTVADDREAVFRSNDCPFALTASVFSRDELAARQLAACVNAGAVTINDLIVPTAEPRLRLRGDPRCRGFVGTHKTKGDHRQPGQIAAGVRLTAGQRRRTVQRVFKTCSRWRAQVAVGRARFTRPQPSAQAGTTLTGQHMKTQNERIGIVGGGLGGLAAACTLAARGYQVTLFERNEWLGGKAAVVEGRGFRFDAGPTIVTIPSVLRRVFAEAGRRLEDYLELVRLDPQWRCFFEDGSVLNLNEEPEATAEALDRFAPGIHSGRGYRAFMQLSRRLNGIAQRNFFYKPIGGLRDMVDLKASLDPKLLGDVLAMRMGRSVAGTVRAFNPDPRVAQMVDHFTQYVGSSPYGSPAVLCGIAHMQHEEGVWYPMGGTRAVPAALAKLARELGVEFRTRIAVEKILTRGGTVTGIRTNEGEEIPLRAVISNCDSVRTHRELLDGRVAANFEKRRKYEAACSGVVLYLGLNKRYAHLAHHDFVFSRDPHEEFDFIYNKGEPAPDPTCYLAATAATDPGTAPAGGEALYVLVHTPYLRPHHDWNQMLPAYRKTIIEKLKRTGNMPDLEDRIVFEQTLTPQDINDRYHVLNGAIYGLASHGRFFGAFKPSNRSPDVRGLYLAGGAAHPGPGMPMVLMSGWIAADALDQDGVVRRRESGTPRLEVLAAELVET